jgi:hypothetical protein
MDAAGRADRLQRRNSKNDSDARSDACAPCPHPDEAMGSGTEAAEIVPGAGGEMPLAPERDSATSAAAEQTVASAGLTPALIQAVAAAVRDMLQAEKKSSSRSPSRKERRKLNKMAEAPSGAAQSPAKKPRRDRNAGAAGSASHGPTTAGAKATGKKVKKEPEDGTPDITTAAAVDAEMNGGGRPKNSTIGGGPAISGSQKLGPYDFVIVPKEDYEEALIVKRSLRRAGPDKFRAKRYYAVFFRNNMKKTAVYADWDSVEVLKIKHTGYFKFKREKSFTAAYNRIVAFITHYNEKLCTDIDSDSEGDDE